MYVNHGSLRRLKVDDLPDCFISINVFCIMMMTLTSGSGYIFALRKLMCRIYAGKIVHQYVIL
jgi:hypothetical protein